VRICITPRWAGNGDDDWYPWLGRRLRGHEVVVARLRPSPGAPEIHACVDELERLLGTDREALSETFLVGHSVGCQASLRFAEALPEGTRLAGVLCVAGWFWVDAPWDTIRPWVETPMDLARVRRACPRIEVLLSDGDPFTSDAAANAAAWRERLGAEVRVVEGAGHFNRVQEPTVLEALCAATGIRDPGLTPVTS